MSFKKDFRQLLKPYYWVNILLSISYVTAKRTGVICNFLFPDVDCELDSRETEILFFLIIVVMLRTRKAGSVTMVNYLSASFVYTKIANLILWLYADVRYGLPYGALLILTALLIPEPTYTGPEHVTYFRGLPTLDEELRRQGTTWLVCLYAAWHPACVNFAPVFAELSASYSLDNLKFGKMDVGRFTCWSYDGQTEHINVNEVRKDLFASKNKLVISLPPTSAALYKHALRAAYQAGHIWGNALKPDVSIPCPSSWGWTKEKESWTPEWSAVTAIWSQLSLLDHCGCKSGCETMRCECRRVSLPCTAQCKSCIGGCTNQKYPEAAAKYRIQDGPTSRQLPSVLLLAEGAEAMRRPQPDTQGKLQKFLFSKDNVRAAFDLDALHQQCKEKLAARIKDTKKTQ